MKLRKNKSKRSRGRHKEREKIMAKMEDRNAEAKAGV